MTALQESPADQTDRFRDDADININTVPFCGSGALLLSYGTPVTLLFANKQGSILLFVLDLRFSFIGAPAFWR